MYLSCSFLFLSSPSPFPFLFPFPFPFPFLLVLSPTSSLPSARSRNVRRCARASLTSGRDCIVDSEKSFRLAACSARAQLGFCTRPIHNHPPPAIEPVHRPPSRPNVRINGISAYANPDVVVESSQQSAITVRKQEVAGTVPNPVLLWSGCQAPGTTVPQDSKSRTTPQAQLQFSNRGS